MEKKAFHPPEGWRFEIFEVIPGLYLSKRLVEPHDFASLEVDAIVALDDWRYTWSPPVPENHLYVHFPIEDAETVDPKTRHVAGLVAGLLQDGHRVLVHCVQGLNRSGAVVARALMFLGHGAAEAIELVRQRRGLDEGFGALGNERFVAWLMSEESTR
ncbi:MAG TPA: dual specificity protein phosphatase family protein [Actinomycetota bacterium]|nr:dual specificity protein phosphatase family protein [Actinomycetota bacterium]